MRLWLTICAFVLALALDTMQAADIVPSTNKVDWTFAGVQGGVPYRTTVYASASAGTSTVSTIQTLLNNCPSNQVVLLEAGKYTLDFGGNRWDVPSGITVRGETNSSGWPTTYIDTSNTDWAVFNVPNGSDYPNNDWNNWVVVRTVSSGLPAKGDTQITVSSAPTGLSVGDMFWIDALPDNDWIKTPGTDSGGTFSRTTGGRRAMQQVCRATDITGSVITFEPAISHPMWDKCTSPEIYYLNATYIEDSRWVGIEDIAISLNDGNSSGISLGPTQNSWCRNVCITNVSAGAYYGFKLAWCLNTEIRDCLVTKQNGVNTSCYGIDVIFSDSTLIENNIITEIEGGIGYTGSGNVIAYNYVTNMTMSLDSGTRLGEVVFSHGHHTAYNLLEGNHAPLIYIDFVYGNNAFSVFNRNRLSGWQTGKSLGTYALGSEKSNHNFYAVGNVLGHDGFHVAVEGTSDLSIYTMGSNLRETNFFGNYNTVTAGIPAGEALGGSTISNSYFHTSGKPSWFGDRPWPPFDYADGANVALIGTETNIPAGYRYIFGQWPADSQSQAQSSLTAGKIAISGKVNLQ